MRTSAWSRVGGLLALVGMASGCRGGLLLEEPVDASRDLSDVIPYRKLTRADFKADHPPHEPLGGNVVLNAVTCVNAGVLPETQLRISRVAQGGESAFEATLVGLRYGALMNRKCSWWNPEINFVPRGYVLQHEQIHFALHEIEARRVTALALERPWRATGPDEDAARSSLVAALGEFLEQRWRTGAVRHEEFDDDTSYGHRPARQQRWAELVARELREAEQAVLAAARDGARAVERGPSAD